MTETAEVDFDAKSGISVEEQKEILTQINGIAEKNRRSLSQAEKNGPNINAKKTGAFFPFAVNIAAVVVLLVGAFLLISLNGKTDALVRRGTAIFNLTEREVIEAIRRDTAEKILAKDSEISLINSRLEETDAQLALLSSGNQVLSAQQIQTQERLLSAQNSYRAELALLQNERAQILESSRSREAALRAQLEQRSNPSAAANSAAVELERLTNEQEKIAAIEAFLAGGYEAITVTVQNSGAQEQELAAKNAELEKTIASLRATIDSLDSGGSANTRRLVELEEAVSTLRAQVSSLETGAAEKDRTISSLNSENAALQSANTAQEQEIANLRNQLTIIRQALQE